MQTYITITLILAFIIVLIFVILGYMKFKEIITEQTHINKNTRLCFNCDKEYSPKDKVPYLYCPYCGKKTFGFDDESYERFTRIHAEPIILPNYHNSKTAISTKEELDFDTWLENQPEGTFVQGGGIDKENSPNNDKKD